MGREGAAALTIGGGIAGGLVGGPAGAAIGAGVGSTLGSALIGEDAAKAQSEIAKAQEAEQRRTQQLAMNAANPSPQEVAQLEEAVRVNSQDIARKERILASTDPAIIEAGTQALQLLRGQDAATLDPIRRQRQKERLQLEDQLRTQLGAGYANSTAGIQALSAFDEATTNALAGAQQQSLSQLLGLSSNFSSTGLGSNVAAAGSLASLYGNQSARMANAITGNRVDAAGSQFVGDLARAQNAQQTLGNITNLAGTVVGSGMFSGGTPSPTAGMRTSTTQSGSNFVPDNFSYGSSGYLP